MDGVLYAVAGLWERGGVVWTNGRPFFHLAFQFYLNHHFFCFYFVRVEHGLYWRNECGGMVISRRKELYMRTQGKGTWAWYFRGTRSQFSYAIYCVLYKEGIRMYERKENDANLRRKKRLRMIKWTGKRTQQAIRYVICAYISNWLHQCCVCCSYLQLLFTTLYRPTHHW